MTLSNRLPPLLLASVVGLLLPLVALEHRASACGATEPPPPGYVSVTNPSPADRANDVPIDAAVGVNVLLNSGAFAADPTLILRDLATGEAVPGTLGYFQSRVLRFKPSERLTPNHEYAIEVTVTQSLRRPADAQGVEELRTTFTTGDSAAPALKVVGMLEVALEAAESPAYGSCSCSGCVPTGTLLTTSAQLSLPGVTGGDSSHDYQLRVVVTAHKPFDFATPKGADAGSPDPVHLEFLELVGEKPGTQASIGPLHRDEEYPPCFAIEATDFFGNTAIGEPVCLRDRVPLVGVLDQEDAGAPTAVLPTSKDAGAAAKPKSDDDGRNAVSIEASSGCRFAPSATPTSGWFLAVAALAVGSFRRRSDRLRA